MKEKMFSATMITLLVLSIMSGTIASGQDESPEISVINPFNETGDFIFASNTTVGYKFDVAMFASSGTNVSAWQVTLNYNATILNATRVFIPTSDTQYIFYGRHTLIPQLVARSNGSLLIGDVTTPQVGVNFTTPKKLVIVEFQVLAKPPPGAGNRVFSALDINNSDTFLLGFNQLEVPSVKTNGYYELNNKEPSQTSISASPTPMYVGANLTVNGTISTVPANRSITFSGVRVTIWHRVGTTDAFTNLTTVLTDSTSHYLYYLRNIGFGVHQFESSWAGNSIYQGFYSGIISVTVKRLNSTIILTANPASVQAGSKITFDGSIIPARAGVTVTVLSGTATLAEVTTAFDGSFSYNWTTSSPGTFELTAKWDGDATYDGAVSKPVTVDVAIPSWLYYISGITAAIVIITLIAYYLRRRSQKSKIPGKPRKVIRNKSAVKFSDKGHIGSVDRHKQN